jgi:transposase InsO family protein
MGSGFESPLASSGFTARQQALAREWAYGQTYASSTARRTALTHWLEHYNTRRRHSASGDRPPITRVHQVIGQNT